MSKVICVILMVIIMTLIWSDKTVASARLRVNKGHLRKCRCKVSPSGREKCRYPLFPQSLSEQQGLMKCFCSKANEHKFKEFQPVCRRWGPGYGTIPITLT